jgi:hypothetical protein
LSISMAGADIRTLGVEDRRFLRESELPADSIIGRQE